MNVIVADGVSKRFLLRHSAGSLKVELLDAVRRRRGTRTEEFWALRDVSLRIERGESMGLVGRNGSGKSTFLKLVAGIQRPTTGHLLVKRNARIGTMIELGLGFHAELSGGENVYLNAAIQGLSRSQIEALYPNIVEYAGLARFMDVPLKSYSSGMRMRLGFAIASQMDPHILLLDEIFAVGDQDFQRKCFDTLKTFRSRGCTILFVSHAASAIQSMCDRVAILDGGRLVFDGSTDRGLDLYRRMESQDTRLALAEDGRSVAPASRRLEEEWHRRAGGPKWAERGAWELEFLRAQGLTPSQFVLDVACGDFSGALNFLRFMEQSRYWGYERQRHLFDAASVELTRAGVDPARGPLQYNDDFDFSSAPYQFDFVLAGSLFVRLPLNQVAQCVAAGLKKLKADGRMYATFYDVDAGRQFEPQARCDAFVTYGDREPYHYAFPLLERVCETIGGCAERLNDRTPAGESVMVIRPARG